MRTLNLARDSYSQIKYTIANYPDKQQELKILSILSDKEEVKIICRLITGDDLMILLQALNIFHRHEIPVTLSIKYLMYSRMDRLYAQHRPFSLKIIKNIINNAMCYHPLNRIETLDVHNPSYLQWDEIKMNYALYKDDIICYPDEGAYKRLHHIIKPEYFIICDKVRDLETGTITKFKISHSYACTPGRILVIDDLCDGGGTFDMLHEELTKTFTNNIDLYITHSIQVGALERLATKYNEITTTNSFSDLDMMELPSNVVINDVLKY